jgi:outer membrane protein assembly factor BamB
MPRPVVFALIALTGTLSACQAGDRASWPQWRGPDRTCSVAPTSAWPEKLDEATLVEQYRIPLASSYSGPIVSGERVFVTETVDRKTETVRALDRDTGRELWKVEWPGSMTVPFFAASNGSWIRSTPVLADGRLFVCGMQDVLVALDAESGAELWRRDFIEKFSTVGQSFGFVCSPLVHEGFLFVQTSGGLVKLNCETGDLAWRSLNEEGGMMGGAFSSPMLAEIAGKLQLVVQTRAKLCGVDLETGEELWSEKIPSFRDMNILTPTVLGDRIFTSSYGGGSLMYEIRRENDSWKAEQIWKNTTEAYMSSPVVIDDRIYLHLRNQRFACIDPATGDNLWRTTPFGEYWSLVRNGSRMLALDERGDLILIDATPIEFRQLDTRHVTDATAWAHLAVADDQVFVRALDSLIVFKWK